MSSVLDLLINEVANVLGITPDEVKNRFTKEELDSLLNNSLCEPDDSSGIPLGNISDLPCDDLEIPDLLPAESADLLDDLEKQAADLEKKDNSKKCIGEVEKVNSVIEIQIEEYNKHKILLEKLIEYRDNYFAIGLYFTERSNEAAKLLGDFKPILLELRRLEAEQTGYQTDIKAVDDQIKVLTNTTNYSESSLKVLTDKKNAINKKLSETQNKITKQNDILRSKEQTFPIFNNQYYKSLRNYAEQNIADSSYYVQNALTNLTSNGIGFSELSQINTLFQNYSELVTSVVTFQNPQSIQQLVENNYFRFKLRFIKLYSLTLEKEVFDKSTGEKYSTQVNFPIYRNPLLKKSSFFDSNSIFALNEFEFNGETLPTGRIYTDYYNLFKDPVKNFFSLDERGLTENVNLVDPKLKGTGSETKRDGNAEFYIKDIDVLQNFYETFDDRFELRKEEVRKRVIIPGQEQIRLTMQKVARQEVQLVLGLVGLTSKLPEESSVFKSVLERFKQQNLQFSQGISELDEEINRITLLVKELKPTPDKIRKKLKEQSPECFDKIDNQVADCGDTKAKLGIDPLFTKSLNGTDPTLPTQNQLCYWLEFSKIINKVGLLPIPNLKGPPQLRYWPVGLIIPYPGGLIKIPLPIIWIPLVVISTPAGNIVIFLTINGIFISPVVFFVSSTGFKQHILTVRGSSEKFGYSAQDEVIKRGIQLPAGILAAKEIATKLAQEAALGKYYHLGQDEYQKLVQQRNILNESFRVASESGNVNKLLKIQRERKNLEESVANIGSFELLAKLLDKQDTAFDAIKDAKCAIYQRLDEIGKPQLDGVNKLKSQIIERQQQLLSKLQEALVIGDDSEIARIRKLLSSDGVSLNDKLAAIESDMKKHFDKIKFPKIIIPKDTSAIDPKLNGIVEFIKKIFEYTNIYGTQFFSKENLQVRKLVLVQVAKGKDLIKAEIDKKTPSDGKLDVEKNIEEIRQTLLDINKKVIDTLTGKDNLGDPKQAKLAAEELEKKLETETDPVKRRKLRTKIELANKRFENAYESDNFKKLLAFTPDILAALGGIKIDFDPFAPCCAKKPFSVDLSAVGAAFLVIESVKSILDNYMSSLSPTMLKSLLGGKTTVTPNELISAYTGMITNQIPKSIAIPAPAMTVIALLKSMSGILLSTIEPKAPNVAAQPQLPAAIVLDLNLLKAPLLKLLLAFLENSLPFPESDRSPNSSSSNAANNISNPSSSSQNQSGGIQNLDSSPAKTSISDGITIVNCEPDNSNDSVISDGVPSVEHTAELNATKNALSKSIISSSGSGNVVVRSSRDILPSFQTLDLDFLSINPSDFIAILKNFIDLKFDAVAELLDPFYKVLSVIKGVKGVNLNVIEDAQYKIPPYGPPTYAAFVAYTKAKQFAPKSANFPILNVSAVQEKTKILEATLGPISNSPLPAIIVAAAGAADAILPIIKAPQVDVATQTLSTKDLKVASLALRALHPLISQDDLPPWERLSGKNLLFLLFADQFVATGADQVGFFRSFV